MLELSLGDIRLLFAQLAAACCRGKLVAQHGFGVDAIRWRAQSGKGKNVQIKLNPSLHML